MTANLIELYKHCPDLTIAVKVGDLIEANNNLIDAAIEQLEQQIADNKRENYLSAEKVCEMLDISTTTLWRWDKSGYLKHIEVGGKRRYKQSDINAILEGEK